MELHLCCPRSTHQQRLRRLLVIRFVNLDELLTERLLDTEEVTGSIPVSPTTIDLATVGPWPPPRSASAHVTPT